MRYDVIIVGAGFAGAVVAERLAARNKKVLILESRNHIGGNAFDYDQDGILIHKYGPHIFHTNSEKVYEYLSQFTEWYDYHHCVLGHIQNKVVPIPFNFASIDECFHGDQAERLKAALIKEYGRNARVPIMELRKSRDRDVNELADFVFENVFKYYTMKQWGLSAEEIDSGVTARVPVRLSYKDGYFDDKYQVMPKHGYTALFKNMLQSSNIEIRFGVNAKELISLDVEGIKFNGEIFKGQLVYTGALDELFDYYLGELPYRSLDLVLEKKNGTFQTTATENYPGKESQFPYTRITEYKHFMENEPADYTYIHTEYPLPYVKDAEKGNIPYYPVFTEENQRMYNNYVEMAKAYPNLILLGRLAEYKYYNMDAIVERALLKAGNIV